MPKLTTWQVIAISAGVLGLATGFLWGSRGDGAPAPGMIDSLASGGVSLTQGGISVTGSGSATGIPDALTLTMGVQTSAQTVGAALGSANAAASKVQTTLRAKGVAEKDLQTSNLTIQPRYSSDAQNVTGYQVSESLTATIRGLKTAGDVISAAAAAGGDATRVESVALDLSDITTLMAGAREAAFTQARTRATQYARAAGADLGKVVSIQESSDQDAPSPSPATAAEQSSGRVAAVPVTPGSQNVVVKVTVVFAIA
jgi:uncharacterized protein YggE